MKDNFERNREESFLHHPFSGHEISEKQFALDTLERYTGSPADLFCSNLLLTNFPTYVEYFARKTGAKMYTGSMFQVAHAMNCQISMLDVKIGSPAAALAVDLCSFLPGCSAIILGMSGGLRRKHKIGDLFIPIGGIRDEGTSDHYLPSEVPALSNFLMTKAIIDTLEEKGIPYHMGVTYTTNRRLWEYNEGFKKKLNISRAQVIDMECATIFIVGYSRKFNVGALLLISDLPLNPRGVKTKKSSEFVYKNFMDYHIELGMESIRQANRLMNKKSSKYSG